MAISQGNLTIFAFKKSQIDKATEKYYQLEQSGQYIDQVLVEMKNINQLKRAYPNYFADASKILDLLDVAEKLAKNPELV